MTTIPLAEVRAHLSQLVDEAVRTHQRVDVTKNGRRAAVLLSADDYDSIMETLDILSDSDAVRDIALSREQMRTGEVYSLDDVEKEMRAEGRL